MRRGSPETWTDQIPCGWCGAYVPETESGRGRRWCSDACRMKSYRAHKRARGGDLLASVTTARLDKAAFERVAYDARLRSTRVRGTRLVVQSLCGLGLVGRGPL